MKKEIIFIGQNFYNESQTDMSPIYEKTAKGFHRFDWGFASLALAGGDSLFIRPATPEELTFFRKQLKRIKEQKAGLGKDSHA